jgi:hypothetical protein
VSLCVSLLSLLRKGSVDTFPRQLIHATIQLLDASFSIQSVSYQKTVSGFPILVYAPPKRWSEGSASLSWDLEPRITVLARVSSNLLDWTVYPLTVSRQQLAKHAPATKKNCRRRRFLCGQSRIRRK